MRTFVFGAGASFHAGYPLSNDLWRAMEDWARNNFSNNHLFRDVVEALNERFDTSKSFELVLTDLDMRIKGLSNAEKDKDPLEKHILLQVQRSIATMIPSYFDSLRGHQAELYDIFATDLLAPGDALITFNYDLALDRALKGSGKWSVGDGYGFAVDTALFGNSSCLLLKLHGSTNWRGELFQGNLGFFQGSWTDLSLGQRPVIYPVDFEFLGYPNSSDPRCHNARASVESLILPTANKEFFKRTSLGLEWEAFWNCLWVQAENFLKESDEVFLIGYSVPEYDTRARALLKDNIKKSTQIQVCCHTGTTDVVKSLKGLGLANVRSASSTTFEAWVKMSSPQKLQHQSSTGH